MTINSIPLGKQCFFLLGFLGILSSCETDLELMETTTSTQAAVAETMATTEEEDINANADISLLQSIFSDKSMLAPLVEIKPAFSQVNAYSLISSSDEINGSFKLAGSADGAGFLKEGDHYIYVVNCEDSYAVARITLDETLTPISGDYLLNSGVGDFARQCSGTMWEAEIHGGDRDLFLSASENMSFQVKGIDPRVATPTPQANFSLEALGAFSWENAVPLPKNTYPGATVIMGGDDDSSGSEGQVVMYYSQFADDDLEQGGIYVLRLKEIAGNDNNVVPVTPETVYNESSLNFNETYAVEFVLIEDGASLTKNEMETACMDVFASQFMRVEDVDYRKGPDANATDVYFAASGKGPGQGTYNDWGTVYKLSLDPTNPLEGELTQIISGNSNTNNQDGNLSTLQSPDNLCVTENYVYVQEDPNSFSRGHGAYIYQTDLNGNNPVPVMELMVNEELTGGATIGFNGEFGSLIDISDKVNFPDTFLLAVQPHYWQDESFQDLDGHTHAIESAQGSQIILLRGLPR